MFKKVCQIQIFWEWD